MAGIYIHIPFCKRACHYCDFHFSTNLSNRSGMVAAIAREASLQRRYLDEVVETIYLGGGTPSLLHGEDLHMLFDALRANFSIAPDAEITLEANPDDLTGKMLQMLVDHGVNRLSIGVQSYDNHLLAFLNRVHDGTSAEICVERARDAGFGNINVDLMYAIPGLDPPQWEETLNKTIALRPEHISAYALTIEPHTVFGKWETSGRLARVDEEAEVKQWQMLSERLKKAGYDHYEVSNFSLPGFESKHNSAYWLQKPYLGLGPAAHSFNRTTRQFNVRNNYIYMRSINEGSVPFTLETRTRRDQINEYLMTSLRTRWGCDLMWLMDQHAFDLRTANESYIQQLVRNGMANLDGGILKLTPEGLLLADKITADLFLADHRA